MRRILLGALLSTMFVSSALAGSIDDFNSGVNATDRLDSSAAIVALTRALASRDLPEPIKPVAYLDRGIGYVREDRFGDAINDFNAVLHSNAANYEAIYWRMIAYARNGQYDQAVADCSALTKIRPRVADLHQLCGVVKWMAGDFQGALLDFETAISTDARPSILSVLWFEITQARTKSADEAQFIRLTRFFDLDRWPAIVLKLYLGKSTPDKISAEAEDASGRNYSLPFTGMPDPGLSLTPRSAS